MRVSIVSHAAVAVLTAIALALLGAGMTYPARAATHAVEISGFAFGPPTLTVTVGDTVTWTNLDPVVHTATSTTGAFDSGDLAQNESFSVTFSAPGTFDYRCTPHPTMTGRIVVQAAAATAAPTAAPTTGTTPAGGSVPNVAMRAPAPNWLVVTGLALLLTGLALGVKRSGRPRD